jgi:hypothetical protein
MGKKTLSFKGTLTDLLKSQKITFTKKKSDIDGYYWFIFRSAYCITFRVRCNVNDFPGYAKQFVQMELVRMGDKSQLYVSGTWRPVVNVNF